MKNTGYRKRMKLRLKESAVPNTHPEKDELQLFLGGQVPAAKDEFTSKRVRLNRRTLNEMHEFSSSIDTDAYPYTAPTAQQDNTEQQGFYLNNEYNCHLS